MPSGLSEVSANVVRADDWLREAKLAGVALAVLPEMFNTGYGLLSPFGAYAEASDGPTIRHLRDRSRLWKMGIAAGFLERDGRHLHNSLALCLPDGSVNVYRKRHLVFWERFRCRPGRSALVVATPWGRLGLAICADMLYQGVWDAYRERIDLAVISAAWPDFASRQDGRKHWLLGHLGPMAAEIPAKVARDLGVPVLFANQCGATETIIPVLGLAMTDRIADRFAGRSSICDGCDQPPVLAGSEPCLLLSEITTSHTRGIRPCRITSPSVAVVTSSAPARSCSA
ncbi:carbon-nitrogen hydrolase family protein [Singulisphaera sp. PoT]|uniref:carbon-nitrogen hydrolase family protein n=1 Tax=Singulisphaera sp. PoT TaxID=3411797 RepID=UPI003BF5534F